MRILTESFALHLCVIPVVNLLHWKHMMETWKRAFTHCRFRVGRYIKENVVPALPVSMIYGALFLFRTFVSMVVL